VRIWLERLEELGMEVDALTVSQPIVLTGTELGL